MNERLALNKNVIQWRLARRPFYLASFLYKKVASKFDASFLYVCHRHKICGSVLTSDE